MHEYGMHVGKNAKNTFNQHLWEEIEGEASRQERKDSLNHE
jgi:hypothetical protein